MTEEALFHQALALPDPAARAAFLDGNCPDAELRRRVEALLHAHDRAGGFLGRPADPGGTGSVVKAKPVIPSTIPIVFAMGGDPVKLGVVASFAHPGDNITGVCFLLVMSAAKLAIRSAAARHWAYLSPIAENWITSANYHDVIDTSTTARDHPSTAGHAYLADRVAADLRKLEREPVVVADGTQTPTPTPTP